MKVLVAVKRVPDPNVRVRVKADLSGVDLANVKMSMNPFDEIAVEAAVRLRESGQATEVVAVSIGPAEAIETLRVALAMGADRAILVRTDAPAEPLAVAKTLAAIAQAEAPDLVILGKQAIDDDANQTGQMLAQLTGRAQGACVSSIAAEGGALTVTQETDGGTQTLRLTLPAVVTADLRLNQPRYASLPNIMKAKRKPVAELSPADLGIDLTPRLRVLRTEEPAARSAGVRVGSVAELIGRLRADAAVICGMPAMTTLLLADHDATGLTEQTARALTAALAPGAPVHVLVAGHEVTLAAGAASALRGVAQVLVADDPALRGLLPGALSALILSLAAEYDAFVAPASATGKAAMPRIAAALDVMQVSDVSAVLGPDTFQRPLFAGNVVQTVQATDARRVLTVRTASFAAAGSGGGAPMRTVAVPAAAATATLLAQDLSRRDRPDLAAARIVVSGGRAMASKEGFAATLLPLADALGAAVGASRAAVDAGYAPNDWQVGQTGKVVAPDLYIACGISGAIQHLAGMKDSRVIVAINTDPDAPIFQVADYGLVADLFQAVPDLTRGLG